MDTKPESSSAVIWRKSRRSADQGNCVEVTASDTWVMVRDSRDRKGPILETSTVRWQELLRRVRNEDIGGC
ncbi:MAG: DUF397 domain-containing protein [Streptosporangiaceae bacterium]